MGTTVPAVSTLFKALQLLFEKGVANYLRERERSSIVLLSECFLLTSVICGPCGLRMEPLCFNWFFSCS